MLMPDPRRYGLAVLLAVAPLSLLWAADAVVEMSPLQSAVDGEALMEYLSVLADDAMEGRSAGTPGGRKAGDYIAEQFEQMGLQPGGVDGTYFQPFTRPRRGASPTSAVELTVTAEGETHAQTLELEKSFEPFGFSGEGEAEGEVVFAGYGITAPEHEYDDYEGLDVEGKIVVLMRYAPAEGEADSPFRPVARNRHAFFAEKFENARRRGAAGIVLFTGAHYHAETADDLSTSRAQGVPQSTIPFVHVAHSAAKAFFERAGVDIDAVQKEIDAKLAPNSFAVEGARAKLRVAFERLPVTMRNVIAMLPGADPQLESEVIVLGAHYDHIGVRRRGPDDPPDANLVYNGADDNASGTAGVLAVAKAMVETNYRPRRTILFILFDAEEIGLIGSGYFVANPTVPRESIAAMINLDMIGRSRNRSISVGGVGSADGLREAVAEANRPVGKNIGYRESAFGPSDHLSFARQGIPVLFFNTGMHADLHQVTDEIEKINAEGALDAARVVCGAVAALADADTRPVFVGEGGPAVQVRRGDAHLGVAGVDSEAGAEVTHVAAGSPAAEAGLEAGDAIAKFDGEEVGSFGELAEQVRRRKPGDEIVLTVTRGNETLELPVKLGGL